MLPQPTLKGICRAALVMLFGLPVRAGKVAVFNINHIASSDALVWTVEFEPPKRGETLRYMTGGHAFSLPPDRTVKIPFHGSCSFFYDRSKCWGPGTIGFRLRDDGNNSHRYQIADGGELTDLDAAQPVLAQADKGVLSLVPVDKSKTGLATIAILQNELKR